ncbi:MAG: phosphoribosylformylglycinamidine synthase I [Candidatus Jordarchaeum sp.]|uniref:phosphoribosylformylglycinamidine synthase I n=1 Tax=Candidatus Jordarchaeum sp. TaxID=2823881 RepID=UPI00404955D8
MKVAVIRFPGSNCDLDTVHVLRDVMELETELVWHKDFNDGDFDAVVLPGGFSYGDSLRAGVIAAYSPAMKRVKDMAKEGKPVLGICNGFQILIESGLLEGALLRNTSLTFICKWLTLRVDNTDTMFTNSMERGKILRMPIAHNEGRYYNNTESLHEMEENNQIVFRYSDESGKLTPDSNPNGSVDNIAGICNLERNVVGLMPHPERASEPALSPFKTDHGRLIFQSMSNTLQK